jgi:chromosome partitioning protein
MAERGGRREGAGRKKSDPLDHKIKAYLNLDPPVREWIQNSSKDGNVSNSQFVNNKLKSIMQSEKRSKIIAVVNQAGGVAKTTMTMNLGYQLAQLGHRVLLVDLDPQASLTDFMGLESYSLTETIADSLLDDEQPLAIHKNIHSMDLVPCNLYLSGAELQIASSMARELKLKIVLKKHVLDYDFILIDCPPNMGILNVMALTAATHVLVPVQTHYKAYQGVNYLLDTIRKVKGQVNPDLAIVGFLPTLHAKTKQNVDILAALHENLHEIAPIFPYIPRATAFADASMAHKPLAVYARSHPAIAILESIAQSLETLNA